MEKIEKESHLLKSGNNYPYQKSILWKFFEKSGPKWEKRYIKQRYNKLLLDRKICHPLKCNKERETEEKKMDDENQSYIYIRPLLGLAEHYEFLLQDEAPFRKAIIKVKSVNPKPNMIEHIQSPIIYKIIENDIFICFRKKEYLENLKGKQFKFNLSFKNLDYKEEFDLKPPPDGLKVPENFDVELLYEYLLKYYPNLGPDMNVKKLNQYCIYDSSK